MKLGVVGPLPPLRGGIAHYNSSLINALNASGHEVVPISYSKLYPKFLFPGSTENDPNSSPFPGSLNLLRAWNPLTWMRALSYLKKKKIDRLIIHHWHPFFAPCLTILSHLKGIESVYIIAHNVLPHEHESIGRILNRFLYKKAQMVIVGASREACVLEEISPGTACLISPHPAYDRYLEFIDGADRREIRTAYGASDKDILFAHPGLVRKYKGLDILLSAYDQTEIKNCRLVVAGEFYDEPEPYFEQWSEMEKKASVSLENRYLDDEELAKLLFAADAVVLPFRSATQSGIAMAALAVGTPVIASSVGSLPDVLNDTRLGALVEAGNEENLAGALNRFADSFNSNELAKRDTISELTNKRFSWSSLASKLTGEN